MSTLNPLNYPACLVMPDRIGTSAWLEHTPFAMYLIDLLRPNLLVELGTHSGISYSAFCQGVKETGASTRCYAVDTWEGDPQAGFYGQEVLEELRQYHDPRYGAFSRLLQSTFDEALSHFDSGTIDLLHIDGYHTYEAVKRDFENWLPMMTGRGVIILHDTNVREGDYGVWRLWEELILRYPYFEFLHGHGLGVVAVGDYLPEPLLPLLEANKEDITLIREFFYELGHRVARSYEQNESQEKFRAQLQEKEKGLQALVTQVAALRTELDDREDAVQGALRRIQEMDDSVQRLSTEVLQRGQLIEECRSRITEFESQARAQSSALAVKEEEVRQLRQEVTTWQTHWTLLQRTIAWRFAVRLRMMRKAFAPTGSKRERWWFLWLKRHVPIQSMQPAVIPEVLKASGRGDQSKTSLAVSPVPAVEHVDGWRVPTHVATADVIVCVHNAFDDTRACLESVIRYSRMPYTLFIVDDGSDKETQEWLSGFAVAQGAVLVRNETAMGYTHAANQGLRLSRSDCAVLLNSDTIVTPEWLDRLIACAFTDPKIGLVGPLSNTASWQSIPNLFEGEDWSKNAFPPTFTIRSMGRLVARYSGRLYPHIPLLNGFCLLVKQQVLQSTGYFDEETFSDGYGEENDYCLRVQQGGWQCVIADDVYVYHHESRSYSHERRKQLSARADVALAAKHDYSITMQHIQFCRSDRVLQGIRARSDAMVRREQLRVEGRNRWEGKRVLFLLPVGDQAGGAHVVLQEARAMQHMGVDARILNLRAHRELYERSYPRPEVSPLYIDDPLEVLYHLKAFDAVIATANASVAWLGRTPAEISDQVVRAYYIQDFEPYFFPKGSAEYRTAWESYTCVPNLVRFTKTEWNHEVVRQEVGAESTVVGPSVNIDLFRPRPGSTRNAAPLRVAAMVRPSTPRRQPEFTMKVLCEFQKRLGAECEVILFGCRPDERDFLQLPRNFAWRHFGLLNTNQVAWLLSNVDIFVDFSSFQAMGLTALEAMACGAAVIVPQTGGASSFARHGENALIVDTTSITGCLESLCSLSVDKDLRERLQQQCIRDVCAHPPEVAALNILDTLFTSSGATPALC